MKKKLSFFFSPKMHNILNFLSKWRNLQVINKVSHVNLRAVIYDFCDNYALWIRRWRQKQDENSHVAWNAMWFFDMISFTDETQQGLNCFSNKNISVTWIET